MLCNRHYAQLSCCPAYYWPATLPGPSRAINPHRYFTFPDRQIGIILPWMNPPTNYMSLIGPVSISEINLRVIPLLSFPTQPAYMGSPSRLHLERDIQATDS